MLTNEIFQESHFFLTFKMIIGCMWKMDFNINHKLVLVILFGGNFEKFTQVISPTKESCTTNANVSLPLLQNRMFPKLWDWSFPFSLKNYVTFFFSSLYLEAVSPSSTSHGLSSPEMMAELPISTFLLLLHMYSGHVAPQEEKNVSHCMTGNQWGSESEKEDRMVPGRGGCEKNLKEK